MATQTDRSLAEALNATNELTSFGAVLSLIPQLLESLTSAANITILAPSNAAFSSLSNATLQGLTSNAGLLTALLQYHILGGTYSFNAVVTRRTIVPTLLTNGLFTNVTTGQVVQTSERAGSRNVSIYSGLSNNSTITTPNITYNRGIIHVIDRFLTIPDDSADTLTAAGLSSLRGAINATSLTSTISTAPDVTIFAPINSGFQHIGSALANLSTNQLSDVLRYHVVTGTIGYSSTFTNNGKRTTAHGNNVTITVGNGGTFVNNARIVYPDLLIANGVIHVIDEVMNPFNQTIANAAVNQGTPVYEGATALSNAPFASGQPTPSVPIIPSTSTTPTSPATSENPSGTSSGLGTGAKAGIGIGAALGALLLIGLICFCFLRRRKNTASPTGTSRISELPDQDRDRKWFLSGKWRTEAPGEERRHELDATQLPAELDATEKSRDMHAQNTFEAPRSDVAIVRK